MIPACSEKYDSKSTLIARDIFLKNNNAKDFSELPKPPKTIILSPSIKVKNILEESCELKAGPKIINPVFLTENFGIFTGFVGFGAPMWTWVLEQLICWGVKRFIFIGWFGKINPKIDNKRTFFVEKALRDEGTSWHYDKNKDEWAYPDKDLNNKLKTEGLEPINIWTTDAMFRQTEAEIDYAIKNNIAGFEMECSALFIVAKYYNCKIASVQMVSDYYLDGKYTSIYKEPEFDEQLKEAVTKTLNIIAV